MCAKLVYEDKCHTLATGYSNTDWVGSPFDRHPTSRYFVFIGGNLVFWKSKKQDVIDKSNVVGL